MLPPCVNRSSSEFGVEPPGDRLRFGLSGIKNVGEGAVDRIVEARNEGGDFGSLYDFCARLDGRRVNRRAIESLIRSGSFDSFKASRAALWEVLDRAIESGQRSQRDRASGQTSLFGDTDVAVDPPLPEVTEWPEAELLAGEKEMLGLYMTGHPLDSRGKELRLLADLSAARVSAAQRGQQVRMAGVLNALDQRKTRKGAIMARGVLEDLGGSVDVVFLPDAFERHAELLRSPKPMLLRGTLQMLSLIHI